MLPFDLLSLLVMTKIIVVFGCAHRNTDIRVKNGLDIMSSLSTSTASKTSKSPTRPSFSISTKVQWELPMEIELSDVVGDGIVIEGSLVESGPIIFCNEGGRDGCDDDENYRHHNFDEYGDDVDEEEEEEEEEFLQESIRNWTGKGPYSFTFGREGEEASRRFIVSPGKEVYTQVLITDAYMPGDSFTVYVNNKKALVTPIVDVSTEQLTAPSTSDVGKVGVSAFNEPLLSKGSFIMRGNGVIDIFVRSSPWGGGKAFIESRLLGSRIIGNTKSLIPGTSLKFKKKTYENIASADLLRSWHYDNFIEKASASKEKSSKKEKKEKQKEKEKEKEKQKEKDKKTKKKNKKDDDGVEDVDVINSFVSAHKKTKKVVSGGGGGGGSVFMETQLQQQQQPAVVHINIHQQQQHQPIEQPSLPPAPATTKPATTKTVPTKVATTKVVREDDDNDEEEEEEDFIGQFVAEQIDTICGAFSSNRFYGGGGVDNHQRSQSPPIGHDAFIPQEYHIFPSPIDRRQAVGLCKSIGGALADNGDPVVMKEINAMLLKVIPIGGRIWMAPKRPAAEDGGSSGGCSSSELASVWTFLPLKIEVDETYSCGLQYLPQRHLGGELNWVLCEKSIGNAAI